MPISVVADVKRAKKRLNRTERLQLPFAISQALNDVAFSYRKQVVNRMYPQAFPNRKNRRFPAVAFRVDKASKRNLRASVYDRFDRYFFEYQMEGGRKIARGGNIAVPVNSVINFTGGGRIRSNYQPRNLKKSWVADYGKGKGIWQQYGPKRKRKARLMYSLKPSTQQTARFPFRERWPRHVRKQFPKRLADRVRRALRTAR